MIRFHFIRVSFHVAWSAAVLTVVALACGSTAGARAKEASTPSPARPWTDKSLPAERRAELVLKEMTLDEKITLLHGVVVHKPIDGWPRKQANYLRGGGGFTEGIPRLGIPDVQSTDGRSGVAHAGQGGRYATALPSPLALSSSWDVELARDYGALLGKECRQLGFQISLGGTANLIREPRNGRCFECLGEDPILIGKMLAAELRATQEQGVVANINRFAVNDQETQRQFYNVEMDEKTLRETDLLAFEIAIKESGVGTVMGAYSRLNGVYCCENAYLLNDVLKKAWGFQGWVMSDWGGTHTTVEAALAGFDQEMPGGKKFGDKLKQAVEKGDVPIARLDDMVRRILRTEFALGVLDDRLPGQFPPMTAVNPFTGAEVAQRVAQQGIVLLKNADAILPLDAARIQSIAVIGSHADVGVLSGWGSDQVDPAGGNAVPDEQARRRVMSGKVLAMTWHPSSPLSAIRDLAPEADVRYDAGDDPAQAARLAADSSVAIVFVHQFGHESADVPDLSLPDKQDELVAAIAAANPRTIVVLENNGPITMPWLDRVGAVVAAWFPGIRGGEAIAGVLFGRVNPSGKLTVTFPRSEADLPLPTLPGPPPKDFTIRYPEGVKVGYKWFDSQGKRPLFPFGFGLSYTTFAYSDLKTSDGDKPEATFRVTNTGRRAGTEIAQVYCALPPAAGEPFKRLVAWKRIFLKPGETATVTLAVEPLHISIFNPASHAWQRVPGAHTLHVGGSSGDLPLKGTVRFSVGR